MTDDKENTNSRAKVMMMMEDTANNAASTAEPSLSLSSLSLPLSFDKDRAIRFFASSLLHPLPAPYVKLDTNRMTLVHFSVHALDLLGVWDDDDDDDDDGDDDGDEELVLNKNNEYDYPRLLRSRRTSIMQWIQNCLFLQRNNNNDNGDDDDDDDDNDDNKKHNNNNNIGGFMGGTFVGPATPKDWEQDPILCRETTTTAAMISNNNNINSSSNSSNNNNNNDQDNKEAPSSFPYNYESSSSSLTPYHQPHIAMTYCALLTLIVLGDNDDKDGDEDEDEDEDDNEEDDDDGGENASSDTTTSHRYRYYFPDNNKSRRLLVEHVRSLQRRDGNDDDDDDGGDGSFGCVVDQPSEQDMRFLYCACAISYLVDDWSGVDIDRAIGYIRSCRAYDGGIALVPGQEGHGGSTFCALAALTLMGRLEEVLVGPTTTTTTTTTNNNNSSSSRNMISWKDELIHWCVHRQQQEAGGMQGRPNKLQDTCYSYWIGGSLRLLGHQEDSLLDQTALRDFILSCQSPTTMGGFSKAPGTYPDILHSFYSLAWLSLSNNNNNNSNSSNDDDGEDKLPLHRLNATLGIRQDRLERYLRKNGRASEILASKLP